MISGLWILCDLWHESGDYPPAPGTDPVHVFLTWKRKWKGCYCNTSRKVLLKILWKILLFKMNYQRIYFNCFARMVLAMVSVDVFVCSPFLSSFHFPPVSLSVLVFRLELSHCLVKTNLKEQQFWWEVKFSVSFQFVLTYICPLLQH